MSPTRNLTIGRIEREDLPSGPAVSPRGVFGVVGPGRRTGGHQVDRHQVTARCSRQGHVTLPYSSAALSRINPAPQ
jgi:hypothetical protein